MRNAEPLRPAGASGRARLYAGSGYSGSRYFGSGYFSRATINLLMKLLATVAAAGVMGIAGAETRESGEAGETPAPTATDPRFASSILSSYPFAEIADMPAGAERLLLEGDSVDGALAGAWPEVSSGALPAPASLAGANTGGSFVSVVSNRNAAFDDSPAGEVPAAYPSEPGTAGWNSGAVFPFPIDEIPEPSSWMLLLCGLSAAAFMARRKRG